MQEIHHRHLVGGIDSGVWGLAAIHAFAAGPDAHAAGYDVARSAEFMPLLRRVARPVCHDGPVGDLNHAGPHQSGRQRSGAVVQGVTFTNGVEVINTPAQSTA